MKKALIFLIIINCRPAAFGTQQQNDIIFYNGQQCELRMGWSFSPLQMYYEIHKEKEYPFEPVSTANWRGHIATWEIEDGGLLLINVLTERVIGDKDSYRIRKEDVDLEGLFGEEVKDGKVRADWFTGLLLIDHDDRTSIETDDTTFSLVEVSGGEIVAEHNNFNVEDFLRLMRKYGGNEETIEKGKAIFDQYYNSLEGQKTLAMEADSYEENNGKREDPDDGMDRMCDAMMIAILLGGILGLTTVILLLRKRSKSQ